jgi:hypothetical protein
MSTSSLPTQRKMRAMVTRIARDEVCALMPRRRIIAQGRVSQIDG